MTFTRDLIRHGNVTLNVTYPTVTYKVTRECHGVDLSLDDFVDQKYVRNKQKIIDLSALEPGIG